MRALLELAERGFIPDSLIRMGARRLIAARLREESSDDVEASANRCAEMLDQLRASPVAMDTEVANSQHYEISHDFFRRVLGPRLKYSACYWPPGVNTIEDAEVSMLELYARRARLEDGMHILDLGCGWGAFTLWAAARYPNSKILAISNSVSQKSVIDRRARHLNLRNVDVLTSDVNDLQLEERFDRVLSIEMFEHVRNYSTLLERISSWLAPRGMLFVHIFCHRHLMYPFQVDGDGDWMARHFFTGGLMPARDTLLHFQDQLQIVQRWELSGEHYRKTAHAWLKRLDSNAEAVAQALDSEFNVHTPRRLRQRWRMFFIACEELFGWRGGSEWLIAHYLFRRRG